MARLELVQLVARLLDFRQVGGGKLAQRRRLVLADGVAEGAQQAQFLRVERGEHRAVGAVGEGGGQPAAGIAPRGQPAAVLRHRMQRPDTTACEVSRDVGLQPPDAVEKLYPRRMVAAFGGEIEVAHAVVQGFDQLGKGGGRRAHGGLLGVWCVRKGRCQRQG